MVGKSLKYFFLLFAVTAFVFLLVVFIHRYNLPYSEEGKYLDELNSVVYEKQAVEVYGALAGLLFLLSCVLWWWAKKK